MSPNFVNHPDFLSLKPWTLNLETRTFMQLKHVRGISSSLYHLFQILITIQVQFPRNFYLQTKAVQLQPALGIVFLSSYSLGRRRATSKFWVTSCFSCFFLSLLNSIVFKMKQLNCSRNRFTRRRERFSLAWGISFRDKHQSSSLKVKMANLKDFWAIDESKFIFLELYVLAVLAASMESIPIVRV